MVNIYGIKNCDTVKKALCWLKENDVYFEFHDFKKEGITKEKLKEWGNAEQGEILFNKKGTTWKKLSEEEQQRANTKTGAIQLMQENTSLIKRPVAEITGTILIGFNEDAYTKAFL